MQAFDTLEELNKIATALQDLANRPQEYKNHIHSSSRQIRSGEVHGVKGRRREDLGPCTDVLVQESLKSVLAGPDLLIEDLMP